MEVDQTEQSMEVDGFDSEFSITVNKEDDDIKDNKEMMPKDKLNKSKTNEAKEEDSNSRVGNGSCDSSSSECGKQFVKNHSEDATDLKAEVVMNGDIGENSQSNASESDSGEQQEDEVNCTHSSENGTSAHKEDNKCETGNSETMLKDDSKFSSEKNTTEKDSAEHKMITEPQSKSQDEERSNCESDTEETETSKVGNKENKNESITDVASEESRSQEITKTDDEDCKTQDDKTESKMDVESEESESLETSKIDNEESKTHDSNTESKIDVEFEENKNQETSKIDNEENVTHDNNTESKTTDAKCDESKKGEGDHDENIITKVSSDVVESKEKEKGTENELENKAEESTIKSNLNEDDNSNCKSDISEEHKSADETESKSIGDGERKEDSVNESDDDVEIVGEEVGDNNEGKIKMGFKKIVSSNKAKVYSECSLVGNPPFINVTYSARGPAPPVSVIGNSLVSGSNALRMVVPAVKSALTSQPNTQYQNQFQFYLQGPPGYPAAGNIANQYVLNSKQGGIRAQVQQINNKAQEKIEPPRAPQSSMDMIELSRWEVKQGLHRRARNTKIRPESELSSLARFLRDFGQDLVKEAVYNDLVKIQQKRNAEGKLKPKEAEDFKKLKSVHHELREKVGPCKVQFNQKCSCGFRTESINVIYAHKQRPHIDMYDMRCAYCSFSTRNPHAFRFHLEGEHNVKAIIEMKMPLWECNLCPYEHNIKNKLTQHKFKCTKNFKLHLNLHPAWMPGPETNFCLENMMYKLPAIKVPPSQMFNRQNIKVQSKDQFGKITGPHQQTHRVGETAQRMNAAARLQNQQMIKFSGQRPGVPNVNLFQRGGQSNVRGGMRTVSSIMAGNRAGLTMNRMPTPMPMLQKQPVRNQTPKPSVVSPKTASVTNVTSKINHLITLNDQVLDLAAKGQSSSGFEICEICGGYVKDRTALRIHFFYAHRIDMPYAVFDRIHPPLYCATCFSRFWTAQGLQKHLDVHKEDSSGGVAGKCVVCGHRVPNILMHMRIVHNKALNNFLKECKCIFCGTSFQNKTIVENHMAAIHGVVVKSGAPAESSNSQRQPPEKSGQPSQKSGTALVKGSVCVLCNLNFGRNVDLTRHCMKVHHTCMKCGMVVADKLSLMKHTCLESPAGLRNCELCGEKGFHPAYHVKHIRDKHLKKCSVKIGRMSDKKSNASEKPGSSRIDEVIDVDSRPSPVKKYKQCRESVLAIEARKAKEREALLSISDRESESSTSSNKRKLGETQDKSEDDSDSATTKKARTNETLSSEDNSQQQEDEAENTNSNSETTNKGKPSKTPSEVLPSDSNLKTNTDSLESVEDDQMDTSEDAKTIEKPLDTSVSPSSSTKISQSVHSGEEDMMDASPSEVQKTPVDSPCNDTQGKDEVKSLSEETKASHEESNASSDDEEDGAAFCGFQSLTKPDKEDNADVESANSDLDSD